MSLNDSNFYGIGLNYKKADATTRGCFSLDKENKVELIKAAKEQGIDAVLVIATCNRTELYGLAQHPFQLIKLLCTYTRGTVNVFEKVGYIHKNHYAITHLFRVGTGLDSQILGDFEIISQLKQSFKTSRALEVTNAFLERLCNSVIQASKRIKNETRISSGTTSVAFASVQYLLNNVENISEKRILLVGTGKMGRNTCQNLVKHTHNKHITLINRTRDHAEKLAHTFNLTVKSYADLPSELHKADIAIIATGAGDPMICETMLSKTKKMLLLDLSVPKNVTDSVMEIPDVTLVHLDQLSRITDENLEKRKKYIPQAEQIMEEVQLDFMNWLENRKYVPTIKALKNKLKTLKDAEIAFQRRKQTDFNEHQAEVLSNRIIQKITTQFANHLKDNPEESITLIQKIFQLEKELQ